ncbi:sporulation protein YtxC [Alicyclobacillus fastidiosus]|uniref:Sporulation protein YtxC n=1 Tax=Alicyclobacillus fastidiosus TaxID=392011 RepID=A0ABV5AK21_9BACL|nr:sporulation protein YtxC [Alicyclobacillus fastidiosus]WEH11147.1 sporulation protein YtxC [Alicyclobacillus fastidiosus]
MNVHTLNITSENAFPALVDKLSAVAGICLINLDHLDHSLSCEYEEQTVEELCNAMTLFLFSDWLFARLQAKLSREYPHLSDDELEYLTLVFMHELRSNEVVVGGRNYEEWLGRTKVGLWSLLESDETVFIEGFARFRLKSFQQSIMSVLRERVHQFMLDREYEESVAMLRYMLETQPESAQELHVFCAPNRVWITDANGSLVRDAEVTEAALAESGGDLNSEDLAMSILITRSPCRIVLHDMNEGAQWPSFSETLGRVFAERVRACRHCSTCQQLKQAQHVFPVDASSDHRVKRNH